MTNLNQLPPDLRAELDRAAESLGCELILVEWQGGALRLVLDRDEGVTVDDCASMSREASSILDVWDWGSGRYTLEVSSPGLDRPLCRPEDYRRFLGHLARVTYRDPNTATKQTVVARLEEFLDRETPPVIVVDEGERRVRIPLDLVVRSRLEIEL